MGIDKKKILVCPLNWGLGHAARDVVIIKRLLDLGHEVVIAGDGAALDLLRYEFRVSEIQGSESLESESNNLEISGSASPKPESQNFEMAGWKSEFQDPNITGEELRQYEVKILRFPALLKIRYSLILPAWLKITFLSPFLFYEILAEHFRFTGIIKKIKPDIVISDNRYGLWNRRVKSVLITHQLSIRFPGLLRIFEYPAFLVTKLFIRQFDQCWIPDYPGDLNLSGDLSHKYKLPQNSVFIGAVSRFDRSSSVIESLEDSKSNPGTNTGTGGKLNSGPTVPPLDLLIMLSGPEPQRSRLQKIVMSQVASLESRCVILQGIPGKKKRIDPSLNVMMYSHLPVPELQHMLISARFIICRAGYTGIMDLVRLGKKALILPTPGQTEQEYLAKYLAGKGMFLTCSQDKLDLKSVIHDLSKFTPSFNLPAGDLLGNILAQL